MSYPGSQAVDGGGMMWSISGKAATTHTPTGAWEAVLRDKVIELCRLDLGSIFPWPGLLKMSCKLLYS